MKTMARSVADVSLGSQILRPQGTQDDKVSLTS